VRTPPALLKFIAKAALNAIGGGVLGDFAVEVLPDMARDVWKWWGKGRPEDQLRAEVEAVAQLEPVEANQLAEFVACDEAAGLPEDVQKALATYLASVPNAVRQSQRRPSDPSGRTLSSSVSLRGPEDVLTVLPARAPRFRPGDQPQGVGDWVLEELLGTGGFGEVWKARNPHLPAPVALKFCTDAAAAKVLRNEAALLGRLVSQGRHPGIVRLLHTYLSAATPCLEYEYVAGGNLAKVIAQCRRRESTAWRLVGLIQGCLFQRTSADILLQSNRRGACPCWTINQPATTRLEKLSNHGPWTCPCGGANQAASFGPYRLSVRHRARLGSPFGSL
jgi:hypothetical protein